MKLFIMIICTGSESKLDTYVPVLDRVVFGGGQGATFIKLPLEILV